MKKIVAIVAAAFAATSAAAGTLVYTPPEVTMIEDGAPMGGSGDWLVPLILLGLLVLALTQDAEEPVNPNGQ